MACCDPAELLKPAEHPLDDVSAVVKVWRDNVFPFASFVRRDVGQGAACLDGSADPVTVVAFVAMQNAICRIKKQECFCSGEVGDVGSSQVEGDRASHVVA